MPPPSRFSAPQRIRVVLASGTLVSYVSVWRAAARALVDLGCSAFFIGGVAWAAAGSAAPWYVLAAVALGVAVRAVDIEARALVRARRAVRQRPRRAWPTAGEDRRVGAARRAADARSAGGGRRRALPCGDRAGGVRQSAPAAASLTGDDGPVAHRGRPARRSCGGCSVKAGRCRIARCRARSARRSRCSWSSPGGAWRPPGSNDAPLPPLHAARRSSLAMARAPVGPPTWLTPMVAFVALAAGLGVALPAVGGVDVLSQVAVDLEQPRIRNLRRVARLVGAFGLRRHRARSRSCSWRWCPRRRSRRVGECAAGRRHAEPGGPAWLARHRARRGGRRGGGLSRAPRPRSRGRRGVHGVLSRLVDEGILDAGLRTLHPRFGTPSRLIDVTAVAQIGIVLLSGGERDLARRAPTPSASSGARC